MESTLDRLTSMTVFSAASRAAMAAAFVLLICLMAIQKPTTARGIVETVEMWSTIEYSSRQSRDTTLLVHHIRVWVARSIRTALHPNSAAGRVRA
jgi:hypothetical protein